MITIDEYIKFAGWDILTQEEITERNVEELTNQSLNPHIDSEILFNPDNWAECRIRNLVSEQ